MNVNIKDIIERPYIILDWNVVKYLKNPREKKKQLDLDCIEIVNSIRKKYEFPYCEAHLRDLARSYSESNLERVNDDLRFLQQVSHDVVIGISDEKFFLTKKPPFELFYDIVNENKETKELNVSNIPLETHRVDMVKLEDTHPMREMLEATMGFCGPGILSKWISDLYSKIFDGISDYKTIRDYCINMKRDVEQNTQNLTYAELKYKDFLVEHMMPFFESLGIDDKNELGKIWKANIEQWLSMNHKGELPEELLVTSAYEMLDFHPLFKEKLKKSKNTLSNIVRDSKIVYYATGSKYFVTEDTNCAEKSDFVLKALGYKIDVISMEKFREIFS
jgi:hypothetical protein